MEKEELTKEELKVEFFKEFGTQSFRGYPLEQCHAIWDFFEKHEAALSQSAVIDSAYKDAIKQVQSTYVSDSKGLPAMLLGDVAELIKITTGKEVDWNILKCHH